MKLNVCLVICAFAAVLPTSGCLRVATAPLRAERRDKEEAFFAKVAGFTPQQIAAFMDNRMGLSLGLTGRQRVAIEAVDLKYARQLHDTAASADSPRAKLRSLHTQEEAKDTELKSLLTPEQFSQYLDKKEEMRASLRSWAGSADH